MSPRCEAALPPAGQTEAKPTPIPLVLSRPFLSLYRWTVPARGPDALHIRIARVLGDPDVQIAPSQLNQAWAAAGTCAL